MKFGKKDGTKKDLICGAITGKKGNGKSSLLIKLAEIYMEEMLDLAKTNPNYLKRAKVLIFLPMPTISRSFQKYKEITLDELINGVVCPDGTIRHWERGIRYIKPEDEEEGTLQKYLVAITKYFKNGLLMLDEANSWLKKTGDLPKWQLIPFTQHRNYCVQIYFCCHRIRDVKTEIRGHFWKYIMFKSNEPPVTQKWLQENGYPENTAEMARLFEIVQNADYEPDEQVQHFEIFEADL